MEMEQTQQAEQPQQVEISGDEFRSWTENRITKEVVKQVLGIRENAKEYLAGGNTIGKDADVSTDRMVGRIEGLTELFNLFHDVKEDAKEQPGYDH